MPLNAGKLNEQNTLDDDGHDVETDRDGNDHVENVSSTEENVDRELSSDEFLDN